MRAMLIHVALGAAAGACYKNGCHRLWVWDMSVRTLSRRVAALGLMALISACSSTSPKPSETGSAAPDKPAPTAQAAPAGDQCKGIRSRCIFEGSYEAGERNYAEQEAKRLNIAELQRLRRILGQQ
ncbi:hypothetical protein BOBR111200_18270 [Bordetella bronchialis]